ncbi:MAG TPA: crosslink repair DNA glycosylase YcaQ family protein [Candidatus Limnocylindria bacterium]|nr:crosslink repair DNA glycosylase YcaQ family protein [Candidatus Limnocylindria bacterium]
MPLANQARKDFAGPDVLALGAAIARTAPAREDGEPIAREELPALRALRGEVVHAERLRLHAAHQPSHRRGARRSAVARGHRSGRNDGRARPPRADRFLGEAALLRSVGSRPVAGATGHDVPSAAMRITTAEARRVAIVAQRLAGPRPRPTRAGILGLVRDIGYLQLDPTNVVARNPYLVPWSRLGDYDVALLDALLVKRDLFETVSLILPASDLTIHGATIRAYRAATSPGARNTKRARLEGGGGGTWPKRAAAFLANNPGLRRSVMTRLRRDGPLPLAAFEDRAAVSWTSGGWNDGRNVTMMLAVLQRRGEVIVAGRRRGQKLWAVADGWLKEARPLSGRALAREATLRALRAHGLATAKQLRRHYAFGRHAGTDALDALERTGEVERVEITDAAWKGPYYAIPSVVGRALARWEPRTTLLSPFDNLIIDRDRTEELFGYRYRMEIYVPPRLRTLGYWAMPVLHGDRIIGSADPRFDRVRGELIVNNVVRVPDAPRSGSRAIRTAVAELAEFVGAEKVRWP